MTQNTLISRIKKVFGADNVSNINKWVGISFTKYHPRVSFEYKDNSFYADGIPKKDANSKDSYNVFRYRGLSSSYDKWMSDKLNGLNVEDVEKMTKRIKKKATVLPKKKMKLEDFIEHISKQ
jgi:hypothetical protein